MRPRVDDELSVRTEHAFAVCERMFDELRNGKVLPQFDSAEFFRNRKNDGPLPQCRNAVNKDAFPRRGGVPAGDVCRQSKARPMPWILSASLLAVLPFHFGFFAPGPLDGITDVPGVRVAHVTKIEGGNIRTGATAVLPNADPWDRKVSAAFFAFNGNGEMTGTHWIEESGYLEEPVVLTDTLDVGRAADGVVSWVIQHHPQVGRGDDVPLPVVAECDDELLNDIQARAVTADDVVRLIDGATTGQFARGSVGAGTGMNAFGFRAGI